MACTEAHLNPCSKQAPFIYIFLSGALHCRSSPFSGQDNVSASGESGVTVVHSPKSGVNFFSLGDFEEDLGKAARRAKPQLEQIRNGISSKSADRKQLAGLRVTS